MKTITIETKLCNAYGRLSLLYKDYKWYLMLDCSIKESTFMQVEETVAKGIINGLDWSEGVDEVIPELNELMCKLEESTDRLYDYEDFKIQSTDFFDTRYENAFYVVNAETPYEYVLALIRLMWDVY